jgi:hypothetical protein
MLSGGKERRVNTKTTGPKIPYGSHDNELTRIAGKLRDDGLEEIAIRNALIEIVEKRCVGYGSDYKQMCEKIARSSLRWPTDTELDSRPEVAELIEEFNERFYVIQNYGGKCRVCSEVPNPSFSGSFDLVHQSFADFRNAFMNRFVKVGENKDGDARYETAAQVWLSHKRRRQYSQSLTLPKSPLRAMSTTSGADLPTSTHLAIALRTSSTCAKTSAMESQSATIGSSGGWPTPSGIRTNRDTHAPFL